MKIYLAGPINQPSRGQNRLKFRQAQEELKKRGLEPISPFDIDPPDHEEACPLSYAHNGRHSAACELRVDLAAMLQCDAVLMLSGWEQSVGAQREHSVACWVGLPIHYSVEELPDNRSLETEGDFMYADKVESQSLARTWLARLVLTVNSSFEPSVDFVKQAQMAETRIKLLKFSQENNLSELGDETLRYGRELIQAWGMTDQEKKFGNYLLNGLVGWLAGERQ